MHHKSYPTLTYSSKINIFSRHSNPSLFRFSKPNLKSSFIMQSQLDTLRLVDTNIIRRKQKTNELLTHVWQKLGGWCNLTTTTKYKSGNGLTPPAANRPAFPSAKRYSLCVKETLPDFYVEIQAFFLIFAL